MARKKQSIAITFVGDEDVMMGHIVDVQKKCFETKNKRKRKQKREETASEVMLKNLKLKYESEIGNTKIEEKENTKHSTSLFEGSGEFAGSDMFIFRTPKSKTQLKDKALEAVKLFKERNSGVSENKGKIKKSSNGETLKVSQSKEKPKATEDSKITTTVQKTPYRLRQKIRQRLVKVVQEETSSSDESSNEEFSNHDDDDEDDGDEDHHETNLNNALYNNEDFFTRHDDIVTSDHTLARLDSARLDQSFYLHLLENIPSSHETEINNLFKNYKLLFRKWMLYMKEGFNVLLHGLGSKRELLCHFREKMLTDFHSILINGFSSNLTIKEVISSIIEEILETESITQNIQEQINFIKNADVDEKDSLFLIIHSIDGVMLRSDSMQNYLSQLAAVPWIHMIASIDHINTPVMWDQIKLSRFNWIWFDATTFKPYKEEVVFENSLLVQPSSGLMLRSLIHVYRSLNPRAKEIFQLIVHYQLDHKESQSYIGLSYQECYRKCREGFLVNSDLTLKAQLTEFKDHKLIKTKKGPDGGEYLLIPLDANSLTEFIEHHI